MKYLILNCIQLIYRIISEFTLNTIYESLKVTKTFPKKNLKLKLGYGNYSFIL